MHVLAQSDGHLSAGARSTATASVRARRRRRHRLLHRQRRQAGRVSHRALKADRTNAARANHAECDRARRSAERRQVDAVQSADATPRRAGRRCAGTHARSPLRRSPSSATDRCTLIDTGGLFDETAVGGSDGAAGRRSRSKKPTSCLFIVDARAGLTPTDLDIAGQLRAAIARSCSSSTRSTTRRRTLPTPSSCGSVSRAQVQISAAHGRGMAALQQAVLDAAAAGAVEEPAAADEGRSGCASR